MKTGNAWILFSYWSVILALWKSIECVFVIDIGRMMQQTFGVSTMTLWKHWEECLRGMITICERRSANSMIFCSEEVDQLHTIDCDTLVRNYSFPFSLLSSRVIWYPWNRRFAFLGKTGNYDFALCHDLHPLSFVVGRLSQSERFVYLKNGLTENYPNWYGFSYWSTLQPPDMASLATSGRNVSQTNCWKCRLQRRWDEFLPNDLS